MKVGQIVLETVARILKVPPLAIDMFSAANQASGLDTTTLPSELIPLNSIQLSRGLLNFTLLQSARDWIFPYWAGEQYNPASPSFIPRSHIGLSINVTNRNWTAVGNPNCPIEPIVDPRGLVTPFRNGWSVDAWLVVDGMSFFPPQAAVCKQSLVDGLPIVNTSFEVSNVGLLLTTYTYNDCLFHQAEIHNQSLKEQQCVLAFAIRPFNPEGINLIRTLTFDESNNSFRINEETALCLVSRPDIVKCSTFAGGDSATVFAKGIRGENIFETRCDKGMANGFAAYRMKLKPGEKAAINCTVPLQSTANKEHKLITVDQARSTWNTLLSRGTSILTPDADLNARVKASLSSLLMFTDGTQITPGPVTYHQFWFRDAAYMLSALDKFGFSSFTKPIIETYPAKQESSGFFRSQKGEWDSNGQALWTVWKHALHSHDKALLNNLFPSMVKGVRWIEKTRLVDSSLSQTPYFGLLPPGLSAEHLGLVDYYFWDNAWSVAGIEAFIRICRVLGREKEKGDAEQLLKLYRSDLESAIARAQQQFGIREIPASPMRGIDCGMIGSCCFWYPLQLLPPNDERLAATLETLMNRFAVNGMFFQDFVHSGMNPYLTLHIAQAWLYGGKREKFWNLLNTVLAKASPTMTFPEAIHPTTGGGSMGDGHHGWVCAEILNAIRDAFVQEQWTSNSVGHELVLCAGVPTAWFNREASFGIRNAPVPEGNITILINTDRKETTIRIDLEKRTGELPVQTILRLPFVPRKAFVDGQDYPVSSTYDGECDITLAAGSTTLRLLR